MSEPEQIRPAMTVYTEAQLRAALAVPVVWYAPGVEVDWSDLVSQLGLTGRVLP